MEKINTIDKYAVICGYEFDVHNLVGDALGQHPQIIGQFLELNDAAHIVRTMNEHGEADMNYVMLPQGLFYHYMRFDEAHCEVEAPHFMPFSDWELKYANEIMERNINSTE